MKKDKNLPLAPGIGTSNAQGPSPGPSVMGHLSIREVTHSSLHITAAFLFSGTLSLIVLGAGRKSKADWMKRCLFRWHK